MSLASKSTLLFQGCAPLVKDNASHCPKRPRLLILETWVFKLRCSVRSYTDYEQRFFWRLCESVSHSHQATTERKIILFLPFLQSLSIINHCPKPSLFQEISAKHKSKTLCDFLRSVMFICEISILEHVISKSMPRLH